MLKEFPGVRQHPEDGFRRLFSDDWFDLYVWYDREGGAITGFQLCYDIHDNPHSLTCRSGGSCSHARIDDGEVSPLQHKGSPILVSDGAFDKKSVLERFSDASVGLDPLIRSRVIAAIRSYAGLVQ